MENDKSKSNKDKVADLRAEMAKHGVDGYIVPRADEFQGEYVPASAERLQWLTGFSGSAGLTVVLGDKAVVMSDGRYTIQLKEQVDGSVFATEDNTKVPASEWLEKNAGTGANIGYDPKLHTAFQIEQMQKKLNKQKITLVPLDENLVDAVWDDRPEPPASKVEVFPETIAGKSATDKREEIAQSVRAHGGKAVVLAAPDSVAWLLNVRGDDVPHVPQALSYAIVHDDGEVDWFIDSARIDNDVKTHIGNHVHVRKPEELGDKLEELAQAAKNDNKPVLLDKGTTAIWFADKLEKAGAKVVNQQDPCVIPRACKTPQEQKAIIDAHERDGVAIVRFLKWVEENAPSGTLTEMDVEDELLKFRKMDKGLRDTSFDTISGWGSNGAIVHYRVTEESNKTIKPPGILLVDSGAQYLEGTTDITRTVAVGKPTEEMKENFTRVLKGHIGIAKLKFPDGVTGAQIDVLARQSLWSVNLDYAHGTGHGVGCYLSVHESGAGISSRSNSAIKEGMLISNEPGYYKEGEYGIRIENLVLVKKAPKANGSTGKDMYYFDTVTLAPIDRNLIKPDMLTADELEWLDDYHERVFNTLSPRLDADEKKWLQDACRPLKKNEGLTSKPSFKNGGPSGP